MINTESNIHCYQYLDLATIHYVSTWVDTVPFQEYAYYVRNVKFLVMNIVSFCCDFETVCHFAQIFCSHNRQRATISRS